MYAAPQPEKEIEEIWRHYRANSEPGLATILSGSQGNGNPAMQYSMHSPSPYTGMSMTTGGTVYGSARTSSVMSGMILGAPNYSVTPYFMNGASSQSYGLAGMGKGAGSYSTTGSYAGMGGGKGGGASASSGSSGGGK
ncbi:MAG: hypothetical protein Q8O89_05025 [Nanoarchaeota archaeon]|nr:hypothetical protein [Nanoarchaeota archaeon]